MSLVHFFLSMEGRISRQAFWLGLVASVAIAVLLSKLIDGAEVDANAPPSAIATLLGLLLIWPSTAISVKRFNDRDWPRFIGYLLGGLEVVLTLATHQGLLLDPDTMTGPERALLAVLMAFFGWSLIDNGFLKGTAGPNRYGPDPLSAVPQTFT